MAIYNGKSVMFASVTEVPVDIVQKTGDSVVSVMSQKAVTDNLDVITSAFETSNEYNILDPSNVESGSYYIQMDDSDKSVKYVVKEDNKKYIRLNQPIPVEGGATLYVSVRKPIGTTVWAIQAFFTNEYNRKTYHDYETIGIDNLYSAGVIEITVPANCTRLYISVHNEYSFADICISKKPITRFIEYGEIKSLTALKPEMSPLELGKIANKAIFNPKIINSAYSSGTLYSGEKYRGCIFRAEKNTSYKITVSGKRNRFAVGGITADSYADGTAVTNIAIVHGSTITEETNEYELTNTEYNYIVVNLAVIDANLTADNFNANVTVEKGCNEEKFTVNGIEVATPDTIDNLLPSALTAKTQQGEIGNKASSGGKVVSTASFTGCVIKVKENTAYKITVKGLHNRFYVSGCLNETPIANDAVTLLYNSGNTTEREQDEICTINSGENKSVIITLGYNLTEPSVTVEYLALPNEDGIEFEGFKLYTAQKIDEMIDAVQTYKCYTTARNVSLVTTTAEIYAMYDELVAKYPEYITKNILGQNSLGVDICEYVFTSGNYNSAETERGKDAVIAKPIILITSGIHGYERSAVMSTYQFFKDLAEYNTNLYELREGVTFKVVPVVTPYSYDNNKRVNENGVNINRNFNYNWIARGELGDGNNYSGASAADQLETQIIQAWLNTNTTAYFYCDFHNSGYDDEVSMVYGANDNDTVVSMKKQFLKGVNKVIPYWKNVRNFTSNIYSYTSELTTYGFTSDYATFVTGIPSLCLECAYRQNGTALHSNETIATGAEALGNMLLEIFNNI